MYYRIGTGISGNGQNRRLTDNDVQRKEQKSEASSRVQNITDQAEAKIKNVGIESHLRGRAAAGVCVSNAVYRHPSASQEREELCLYTPGHRVGGGIMLFGASQRERALHNMSYVVPPPLLRLATRFKPTTIRLAGQN
ncbi:hypothetical protein ACFE04_019564 [Oxalis oulophora]